MSMRYPGGLIASSPVNAAYPSGVWTQPQTAVYNNVGVWQRDPYFDFTTLLLHGDGTNGAQNNTFLDSSTNNFTITRNGNTTQGAFTPYTANGYWGTYFNSGDYLSIGTTTAFSFGTGDFTVEGWIFPTSDNICMFDARAGVTATPWVLNVGTGTGTYFYDGTSYTSSIGITLNQWNHVAVSRASGTLRIFVNGVQGYSAAHSVNLDRTAGIRIGQVVQTGQNWTGYLSNLRIVKGTAVYTSAFTPSATPFTAISGTSLLTCQSNRFIDNSSNAFAITVSGSPSVQQFNPFGLPTNWSAPVLGGSGYFDGSGDYLQAPSNSAFDFGSGSFTLEAFVYTTSFANTQTIIGTRTGDTSSTIRWVFYVLGTSGQLECDVWDTANNRIAYFSHQTALQLNTWNHVALVRNGTDFRLYLNGVQSTSNATSSAAVANSNLSPTIGQSTGSSFGGGNAPLVGYLSNLRVVKSAVYTATFTPPTAPLTAITNTSILLSYTNAGIFDNAQCNNLETVGNAQVSTSVVKYNTGSMAFDGSGDWLLAPSSQNFALLTGDFTIEMWAYFNNTSNTAFFDMRGVGGGSPNNPVLTWSATASTVQAYLNDGYRITSGTLSTGQWYHIALVRLGTTATMYINGVSAGTYTYSTSVAQQALYVGTGYGLGSWNGYIDDLRITKGYARYIGNFTPPIARFPNQG